MNRILFITSIFSFLFCTIATGAQPVVEPPNGMKLSCDGIVDTIMFLPYNEIKDKEWVEDDYQKLENFAINCIKASDDEYYIKSVKYQLGYYRRQLPERIEELRYRENKKIENKRNNKIIIEQLDEFKNKINLLNYDIITGTDSMQIIISQSVKSDKYKNEADALLDKLSNDFDGNKQKIQKDLYSIIDNKINEITDNFLANKRKLFTEKLKNTKSYIIANEKYPKEIEKNLIARKEIDDLNTQVWLLMACTELLQPQSKVKFEKSAIDIRNVIIDNKNIDLRISIEDIGSFYYINKIKIGNDITSDLRYKIGVVNILTKGCKDN